MTALRQSVPGETLAMAVGAYALFAAAAWLSMAMSDLLSCALGACSLWLATRSVGFRSGHLATPIITIVALACAWLLSTREWTGVPAWLSAGIFSASVLMAALTLAGALDVVDVLQRRGINVGAACHGIAASIPWGSHRFWLRALLVLFVAYMIVLPAAGLVLDRYAPPVKGAREIPDMTFEDHVRLRTVEAFTACMFFAIGANVGSFINVVVYRAPRRLSVIVNSSRCPKCSATIAARDNIPVLGWLKLGGRCRSCGLPIARRYPIVEALTGGMFLLFYFVELLSGGLNLPERTPNGYAGVVWIIFYTKWDLIGYYVFHMFLLSTLLTWALIRFDGQTIPGRLLVVAFACTAAAVTLWPSLQLVSADPAMFPGRPTILSAWLTSAIGAAVGVMLGKLVVRSGTIPPQGTAQSGSELPAGLALIGTALGWQAACSIAALTLLLVICEHFWLSNPRIGKLARNKEIALFSATVVHQLLWSGIVTCLSPWWPARGLSLSATIVFVACFTVLLIALRRLNPTWPRCAAAIGSASGNTHT